jgi:hypothetical protein
LGDRAAGIPPEDVDDGVPVYEPYEDDETPPIIVPEADEVDMDQFHKFISASVMLPYGGQMSKGKVISRKRDHDGVLIGKAHSNPIMDTSIYEVEFEDGYRESFAANTIAESIYEQVDSDGHSQLMLDEIIDHRRLGDAVLKDDTLNSSGKQRITTKGWKLQVRWKDGSVRVKKVTDPREGLGTLIMWQNMRISRTQPQIASKTLQ